jgi:uncharacterized protein YraI
MRVRFKAALLAAGVLGLSGAIASAAPGIVDRDSNLRSGPGTNYRVAAVVPAGSPVEVMDCQARWCAVVYEDMQGYIARSLIDPAETAAVVAPQYRYVAPGYAYEVPPYGYGYGSGYYLGPAVGFGYYEGRRHWRGYGSGAGFWFGF